MTLKKITVIDFALLPLVFLLSGCILWDATKLAYGITAGTVSGAYNIISGGVNLAKKLYNAIDEWADRQIASQKVFVKYTHNYKSRAIIDYEKGTIVVETIDEDDPYASLENAIVTTLLIPDDPRRVDLFSDKDIDIGKTPFLLGQVLDGNGHAISNKTEAQAYAAELIASSAQSYEIAFNGRHQDVFGVSFKLVTGHEYLRARRFSPYVEEHSAKYGVPKDLILAIMETESAFNPFAVSSTGAIGLMQIMQRSAGAEVYQYLHGSAREPTRDVLLEPKTNIQYGTIYLHLLMSRHLKGVSNSLSREYCVIAAYNTGPGNLLRTFDSDKTRAIAKINKMKPEALFDYLRANLPYDETRRYIVKVRNSKKNYVNW